MREAVLFIAALAAAYGGFASLAVAMARHWREIMGPGAEGRTGPGLKAGRVLRAGGCLALLASLLLTLYSDGASFGSVLWVVLLSLAAMGVAATLAWRPRWLSPLASLC